METNGSHRNGDPKKRKRPTSSPFRIKTGVIAALRYRSEGNHLVHLNNHGNNTTVQSNIYVEVWADPQPGRDEGLALIGRRMRGAFPKAILEPGTTTRVIEGEIISLLDCDTQWDTVREHRRQREFNGTLVELLVDKSVLQEIPRLQPSDCEVDTSQMSETEKKRYGYEQTIRGKDNVIVKVCLADIGRIASKGPVSSVDLVVVQWKIRKRIPVGAVNEINSNGVTGEEAGKKKMKRQKVVQTQFIGDRNDAPGTQERNWRWMASRITELGVLGRSDDEGFLGEVLSVDPQINGMTLAFVTLRRLIFPELTHSGRRAHHGKNWIFDLDEYSAGPFRVPIEELVIVHRKFQRRKYDPSFSAIPVIQHKYIQPENVLRRLTFVEGELDYSAAGYGNNCHRCRIDQLSDGKQVCSACTSIIRPYRKLLATTLADACDCKTCTTKIAARMEEMLTTNLRMAAAILDGEEIKNEEGDRAKSAICCVCCLSCTTGVQCDMCPVVMHQRCYTWCGLMDGADHEETLCRSCSFEVHSDDIRSEDVIARATSLANAMCPIDFDLPPNFLDMQVLPVPSAKAVTSAKARTGAPTNGKKQGRPAKSGKSENETGTISLQTPTGKKRGRPPKSSKVDLATQGKRAVAAIFEADHHYTEFQPACSRTHQYDPVGRRFSGIPKHQSTSVICGKPDTRRNHRKQGEDVYDDDKHTTGRAARASQRRVMKDIATFGSSSMELDTLAGRESQLRFDRSGIHAWGVFADADIVAGEMVVEYRGVLIGNAMAEKLEKDYEQAKIGSDYMFRIDGFIVCDATKHGNVARFINASCDPNCYTKIISIDGTKRIVIYAKKDINSGEELTYDYKFALEYDEKKRIPCHCGTKECRGFMNWNKRYVVVPLKPTEAKNVPVVPTEHLSMT